MKRSDIRDTAIQKQNAADYYYKHKVYAEARGLCEESITLWREIKDKAIKLAPDWEIDNNIRRCRKIIEMCNRYGLTHIGEKRGRLFVNTDPPNATVRVINIGPRFHQQGMRLEPGKYNLEISAPGCETKEIWIALSAGEDKRIAVDLLETGKVAKVETKPSVIDNERRRLVEELERSRDEQELANIPKDISGTRVSLRKEFKLVTHKYLKRMLKRYNFYDDTLNMFGSFANDFMNNGDGTITDNKTGLMWQKGGSSRAKSWDRGQIYIKRLNKERFAGYSDWRLPTIEEFASLVEREKVNGIRIDPLFDNKQKRCWSSDSSGMSGAKTVSILDRGGWVVNFVSGEISEAVWSSTRNPPDWLPGRFVFPDNYVKAVRSLKER